jgi:ParB-like chromosome segregation protein Spo0J
MTATSQARHIEHLALDDIPRAPRNPKTHELAKLKASIAKYGVTVAGILDERTGRLVAGHGRLQALQEMADAGQDPPPGIAVEEGEWRVPVVRGWASANDSEAEGYLLADNRTGELGSWDERILAEVLDDLAEYNVDLLDIAGYSFDDLDDLVASMGDVEVMEPQPTAARYAESDEEIAQRRSLIEGYADKKQGGTLTEMILVFTSEQHAQAVGHIRAIRARDGEQTAAQVVLDALRAFAPEEAEAA